MFRQNILTMSVAFAFSDPCFFLTTSSSFSSSHSSIFSFSSSLKGIKNVWAMLASLNVISNYKTIISALSTASTSKNIYRASAYKFRFAAFPSTDGSWLNLHLSPFLHKPCLKKAQKTDFGSTPKMTKMLIRTYLVWHVLDRDFIVPRIVAIIFTLIDFLYNNNLVQ